MKMITCYTCGKKKCSTAFNKNRTKASGYDGMCKKCRKAYYKNKKYFQKNYEKNKDKKLAAAKKRYDEKGPIIRHERRRRLYGIDPQLYLDLLEKQNGLCAICDNPAGNFLNGKPRALSLDHDHTTGRVRGLLCSKCNFALGLMQDNPALLKKAADYLNNVET